MKTCGICSQNFDNLIKLSKHIRDRHKNISVKEYYDKFIKTEKEGTCVMCQTWTEYKGLGIGYSKTCCRSCSAKLNRKLLKEDDNKHKLFSEKVKINMKNIWKERESSGEKEIIIQKCSDTINENIKKLNKQERIDRFGWLNKLEGIEREEKIKQITKPLRYYWDNITDEECRMVMSKRMQTILSRSKNEDYPDISKEQLEKTYKSFCECFGVPYEKT